MNTIKKNGIASIWLIFAMIAICLFTIQYITIPKIKNFVLSATISNRMKEIVPGGLNLVFKNWPSILSVYDFVIIFSLLALILGLVFFEIFRNRLSKFFSQLNSNPKNLYIFLFFLSIVFTRYYLNPGDVFMGDSETHMIRSWMVSQHFKELQLPVWSNYWYGGYPLLHYYAPGFFVLTGFFNVIFNDIQLSTKLILWASHIGSIFFMFYFLRESIQDNISAVLGSISYAIIYHRIHIILYQGDLQLSLIYLIYPLIFLCIEKYLNGRFSPRKTFLLFSFATSGFILTHQGYAFFGLIFVAVYLLIRVITWQNTSIARFKTMAFFVFTGIFALLMSSFLLLPFILESHNVRGMPKLPFHLLLPSPPSLGILYYMFRWLLFKNVGNIGYIGISIAAFALIPTIYLIKKRISSGLSLLACLIFSICTLKGGGYYNVKNLNFVVFFITALTAFMPHSIQFMLQKTSFYEKLKQKWGMYLETKIVILLMAIILLDLGIGTFQDVFRKNYDFKEVMYDKILAIDKNYKVIERQIIQYDPTKDLGGNFDPSKLGIISAFKGVQTPLGWFHEGSSISVSYNTEMIKKLHLDLNRGIISDQSLDGLFLMGVKFLIFRDRHHYFSPSLTPTLHYSINDSIIELKDTRPLLMSGRILHVKDLPNYETNNIIETRSYFDRQMYNYNTIHYEDIVKPLIEKMNIHLERGVADYLIVQGVDIPGSKDNTQDIDVQVKDVSVDIDTVIIRYLSNASGFGRLAYSYFPYLDVRVDGKRIPFFPEAMHYIIVSLPKGEHVISIQGRASPLRKFTFFFSVGSAFIVVFMPSRILANLDYGQGI